MAGIERSEPPRALTCWGLADARPQPPSLKRANLELLDFDVFMVSLMSLCRERLFTLETVDLRTPCAKSSFNPKPAGDGRCVRLGANVKQPSPAGLGLNDFGCGRQPRQALRFFALPISA